jgi:hypothetical protein
VKKRYWYQCEGTYLVTKTTGEACVLEDRHPGQCRDRNGWWPGYGNPAAPTPSAGEEKRD